MARPFFERATTILIEKQIIHLHTLYATFVLSDYNSVTKPKQRYDIFITFAITTIFRFVATIFSYTFALENK